MNHLLKAMGFWVWGLVAIGLSVSMVSVSYRMVAMYRAHELAQAQHVRVRFRVEAAPAFPALPKSEKKPADAVIDTQGKRDGQPMISRDRCHKTYSGSADSQRRTNNGRKR